jgi:hypothetical protein
LQRKGEGGSLAAPTVKRRRKDVGKSLLYKVVEISNVDEHSLERTLNEWVPKGWTLDGVQFAMRESSKRPAMAFVLFTRMGHVAEVAAPRASPPQAAGRPDPYERLRQLAEGGDEP